SGRGCARRLRALDPWRELAAAHSIVNQGGRARERSCLADGVWGHRKRAGRAAPEHWTGPQDCEGGRARERSCLADGVWGHRKRAGRAAPEHWTGPQISIIRRALGDPGEDREGLRRGEAAARGRETRTALRHHGTATRKALAEDPVREL